jgi:DNA-binding CsgD family transcriptional regulator
LDEGRSGCRAALRLSPAQRRRAGCLAGVASGDDRRLGRRGDRRPFSVGLLADAARGQATDAIGEHPSAATADARHSATSSATALLPRLTEREHEVATPVERGRTNRQIASALRLSERTVESHLCDLARHSCPQHYYRFE